MRTKLLLLISFFVTYAAQAQQQVFTGWDINPGGDAGIYDMKEFNGSLYFSASNNVNGLELWKSDGTPGGTAMLKDIYSGSGSSTPAWFASLNNKLFFQAEDANGVELWVTDGTTGGTSMVKDINLTGSINSNPQQLTAVGNLIYFTADNGPDGYELWVTDGTPGGTQMIKDIKPTGSSSPAYFTAFAGKLYFIANEDINGYELWSTDGTTLGTTLLKDINPGANGSYPSKPVVYNGSLYFSADDGTNGTELWVSDGTSSGTQMLVNINTAPNTGSNLHSHIVYNGKLYFCADDGTHGPELWSTNGTTIGTTMVGDEIAGANGFSPQMGYVYKNKLYLRGGESSVDYRLYVTDGTASGTQMIQPAIAPNTHPLGQYFYGFTEFNNKLFFSAAFNSNGFELWSVNDPTVGIEEVSGNKIFSVYPNPAQGVFTVSSTNPNADIAVFNSIGALVFQQKNISEQTTVDLTQQASGLYMVKLRSADNTISTQRIIIE